jgi:hypothetical protein
LQLLLPKFSSEHAVRKEQEGQERYELKTTHQLFAHVGDVSLFSRNINTVKQNEETPLSFSKEVGLEVKAERELNSLYVPVLSSASRTKLENGGS